MMMLASRAPQFATEIYPHSSPSTNLAADDFYHTLQSILDEEEEEDEFDDEINLSIHNRNRCSNKHSNTSNNSSSNHSVTRSLHDAIATTIACRIDKSPVWHNRGVKCTASIINAVDTSYGDSWIKGSASIAATRNLRSVAASSSSSTSSTSSSSSNSASATRRRSSIQLSTITEEEE
ncbi:hypothetical protein BDB00DRAFT_627077 [Zychaea mexicana]|uniref:uncharacterized protein n=1 Tax=Zychaea mexicana TaxID=64656 RepID=UPI0022FE0308|nr:uncharacterized protein BDB00DRAFT_627077 [Zychaea mexicana]KAI9497510.1 hypothetical protein BDB00DRAFT_627077 [Zychaea mexicana]